MGLFSSSYKYYAHAGSSNLFEPDNRPNTVRSMIMESIFAGRMGIAEAVIIAIGTNLYARAKSYAKYAAKDPGGYVWKFPTTNLNVYNITTTMLRPYIEAEAGGPIDFRTMYWGTYDNIDRRNFWLEKAINENYLNPAYFPWDVGIGDPVDTNWSPVDNTVEIPLEDPLNPGTYHISDNQFTAVISGDTYHVSFPYSAGEWDVAQGFNLGVYNDGETWIQVRYRMQGGGDQYLYWDYRIGSGDIPALEAEITAAFLNAQYLPIAILMHDTVWFDDSGDQAYIDSLDRLLKDLALDPYDIKEDFLAQQTEDDASGDAAKALANTWDFFIHFNCPLKTTDRGAREYLFHFYDYLRTSATWTTFADYEAFVTSGSGEQPRTEFSVEEGVEYTGYIARYAWSYITRVDKPGTFTPPGWVDPLGGPRRFWSKTYELGDLDYNEGLDWVHGPGNYSVAASQPDSTEHSYTLVVQGNTDGTHSIILMMGPSMEYQINTSQDPVGVGTGGYVDYRYRFVDVELFPDDPEEDSEFRWPIHLGTIKTVRTMHREEALSESLCATVFLVEKQKVKWYQKGFWKWLIVIIVIIIVVILWYYGVFGLIEEAATAALAAGSTTGALAWYAVYVVLSFAVGFLISFAGSLIGGTFGVVFVIVASIVAFGGFQDVSGAWKNLSTSPSWGSATAFLQAIKPYIEIGQLIYQDYSLRKLEDEYRDFLKTAREKYDELQDAWDSFGDTPSWIDPLQLVAIQQLGWAEMPDSYYNRTLETNPGVLGYDLIYNFPELALQLPEADFDKGVVMNMFETFEKQRRAV